MTGQGRSLGARGELAAKAHLLKLGYEILHENYTTPFGEIDLIARDGETLVFVEVKARSSKAYGPPEASVTRGKQQQIRRVASLYLSQARLHNVACRFDVVAVTFPGEAKAPQVELIRGAFL